MTLPKDPLIRDEWIRNQSQVQRGKRHIFSDPIRWRKNLSISHCGNKNSCFGRTGDKNPRFGVTLDESIRMKIKEGNIGGFWYGNVRYPTEKRYCNMWLKLRDSGRIGACWGFKSALSGKMEDLCYHHVYYQEKACCHWDEDLQGYYAWINFGTNKNPNWYRYDIDGDPNKFVPLTRSENSAANFDKLKWIKIFESIIRDHGGKCYFTVEEMREYVCANRKH